MNELFVEDTLTPQQQLNSAWLTLFDELDAGYTGKGKPNSPFEDIVDRLRNEVANEKRFWVPTKKQLKWMERTIERSNITAITAQPSELMLQVIARYKGLVAPALTKHFSRVEPLFDN